MHLEVKPRKTITWEEFITTHPRYSIALDGYVFGEPCFKRIGFANFNHHEEVNRIATRCTAAQVAISIKQGLLSVMPPEDITLWVNDCDQDVCMSVWLFKNWERIVGTHSEPLLSRLLFNVDALDTCAGAYPIEPKCRIMEEMCWIFEPYTSARHSGKIHNVDEAETRTIIEATLSRIDKYSLGKGERKKAETEYEILHKEEKYTLVKEIGNDARTAMRCDGIEGFISCRGQNNKGNYVYSIGNLTPFDGMPLNNIYCYLNTLEEIPKNNHDRWGGSDSCGGSPREEGSKLSPEEIKKVIGEKLKKIKPMAPQPTTGI